MSKKNDEEHSSSSVVAHNMPLFQFYANGIGQKISFDKFYREKILKFKELVSKIALEAEVTRTAQS